MHILVIGTLYEPDLGPSGPLFTMLCEALVQRGHQVTVITMVPHYPSGQVRQDFRGHWMRRTLENGVEVIRIGLPSLNRNRLPQRLMQFACYQVGTALASLGRDCDVVLAANPSLTVWLPYAWWTVLKNKPTIFSVHDVYPDVGIKVGIFRHKAVIAMVRFFEQYCLDHADIIHVISASFRSNLRAMGVPDEKIHLIEHWVDTGLIQPLPKENNFSQANHLGGEFNVLYAGNIGFSQGLENVLAAAEILKEQTGIQFIFVGAGAGLPALQTSAAQRGLKNVQFIPFQPRQKLPEVLACADISLVILRRGIGADSLPSKIFSILASGRPVLASVDPGSQAWRLVTQNEIGVCIPPEDPAELAAAILRLREDQDLRRQLGRNGRAMAEQGHSPQAAAQQFETLLQQTIAARQNKSTG